MIYIYTFTYIYTYNYTVHMISYVCTAVKKPCIEPNLLGVSSSDAATEEIDGTDWWISWTRRTPNFRETSASCGHTCSSLLIIVHLQHIKNDLKKPSSANLKLPLFVEESLGFYVRCPLAGLLWRTTQILYKKHHRHADVLVHLFQESLSITP